MCSPRSTTPMSFSALSYTQSSCKMSFEIVVSHVCSFVVYIGMVGSKRRMINEKYDELDDELETVTVILIGQYRKRM
jgi:hypothetical protein